MSIMCEIKNAIVCIPIKHSKHVMVTRGDINVRYYRYRMKTMVLLLEEFFQNKNNSNRRDNIDSYSYSIELNKIEIFLCELKDLIRLKKFNQVRKRNIILPFSFFYGSKNYISLPASTKDCFYYIAETEVNFDHTIFRL